MGLRISLRGSKMTRSNILFSEKALENIRNAYELVHFVHGRIPPTAKANLIQNRDYATSIINVINTILYKNMGDINAENEAKD